LRERLRRQSAKKKREREPEPPHGVLPVLWQAS
jgi:hypothetical protein